MKRILLIVLFLVVILVTFLWTKSCYSNSGGPTKTPEEQAATSVRKDKDIQKYNLEVKRKQSANLDECDSLSVVQYVLDNYPAGTYLVNFDKTTTFNVPKPALIYYRDGAKQYIFGIVARSKPGERLIEPKNIVGYDQSFIDLDSTDLGTAFFYLTCFECNNNQLSVDWETPVPSHGGLNDMFMEKWNYEGTPFIKIDFHYGRGIGHIDYNYFLIDGTEFPPHLLMTYKGINFKRTLANINNDRFPDYYEFVYFDTGKRIFVSDSVGFIWNKKDSLYVNTRNKRQTRPY